MRQLLLASLLCSVFVPVQAQPSDDADEGPDWYRIELIIYATRDPQAAVSETWPLLPELAYPATLQRIHSSPHRVAAEREFELVLFDSLQPEPDFDLAWDTPVEQLLYDYQQSLVLRQPHIEIEPLFDLDVPAPFTRLPAADREFTWQRKRLDRTRDIDVLLHQSWLQPIHGRENSVPLQIDSELVSGDFPELQGSILIYRARYLHLETNLWLNTDGRYLSTAWTMPLPPLPPPGAGQPVLMSRFEIAPSPQWLALADSTGQTIPTEPEPEPEPESELELELELEFELELEPELEPELETETAPTPMSEERLQAFLDRPDYDFRHAVRMQQRRRMRSGELHYVDHPMFGLLIKISRYPFQPFVLEPDGTTPGSASRR